MNVVIAIVIGFIIGLVIVRVGKFNKVKAPQVNKNPHAAYLNTKIDFFKGAQKAGLIGKEVRIKSNNSELKVPNIGRYDGFIGWAAFVVATSEDSSTSHIQRMLSLNYERAYEISRALIEIGILAENGTKKHTVLVRDIAQIKQIIDKL